MWEEKADVLIDGRDLEPPEPFVRTMEALDSLQRGQKLLLIVPREPFPLYRALELNRISWLSEGRDDGRFEVLMWHKDT